MRRKRLPLCRTCERVGAKILSLVAAFGGLPGGFEGLRPLPRRRGSVLANGGDRSGRVELPLATAAAVSTGLSILTLRLRTVHVRRSPKIAVGQGGGVLVIGVRLKVRARNKVRRTPLGSRFEP